MNKTFVPGKRVTRSPQLPWTSQLFAHFLTKRGGPFTRETKGWLGWKGNLPFFCDCKFTHPTGPTFFRCNTLAYLAGSTLSRRDITELRQRWRRRRRRRQRERQKSNRFRSAKTTTLHVHHAFLYNYFPLLHDYDVKLSNFMFSGGREHRTTTSFFFSWTSTLSFRIQMQINSPQHLTN